MVVRELLTRLGFQIDQKPLKQFEANLSSLKTGLASLGVALSAYGTFQFFKSAADASNQILSTSQKIGVGVESLQRLKYAAEFSDLSLESLAGGLKVLNKNFAGAQEGSKEATKAFQEVLGKGFKAKDYKTTEELLLAVSDRFSGMEDGAKKTALSMKILGKSGADMIPFLNTGSDAIRRQGDELDALGGILGVDALKAGEEFNNGLHRMQTFFTSLRNTIAARFFPAINGLIGRFVEFAKANKGIIKQKLDHYLNAVARTAQFVFKVVSVLFTAFDKLVEALGSVEGAIIATTIAFAAFGFVTGGVSLVTLVVLALAAAIFLLWEDYQTFVEGGDALIEWPKRIKNIQTAFEGVAKVLSFIKGIYDVMWAKPWAAASGGFDRFLEKGFQNKVVKARSRSELDDARSSDIGNLVPQLNSPFLSATSGYTDAQGNDLSPFAAPPLLSQSAPSATSLAPGGSDKTLNNNVQVQQAVNVVVQTDADPDQIAEAVSQKIREQNENDWLETGRALEGGAFN